MTRREEIKKGLLDSPALILGAIPFGLVTGLTAIQSGFPLVLAFLGQAMINAGASQLAAYQLYTEGSAIVVILLTVAIINLRMAMYSAALAPHWKYLPLWLRAFAAHFIVDPSFSFAIVRYTDAEDTSKHTFWYFLTLGIVGFLAWVTAGTVGAVFGAEVPEAWSLDFGVVLLFIALVSMSLRDRPNVVAAIVGGAVAVVCHGLPYNLGLMLGAFSGIAAGYVFETLNTPPAEDIRIKDRDIQDKDGEGSSL